MLLGSKSHTAGDTRRWIVSYDRWLDNAAEVSQIDVQSSSATCTVNNVSKEGNDVVFFLTGGQLGETLTVTLQMTDSFDNIKTDTLAFTVVAP